MNITTFEEQLNTKGYIVFTNVGVSMMPLLRQGRDLMVIKKRPPERLKKYDAVLFKRDNGQYILHRILKVNTDNYFIVGDNCTSGEYVREEQVLGILTDVKRGTKEISVNDFGYKLYVHLWCDFYILRVFLLKMKHLAGKILRLFIKF